MPIPQLKKSSIESWKDNRSSNYVKNGRKKPSKHPIINFLLKKRTLKIIGILLVVGIVSVSLFIWIISRNLPNPDQLLDREIAQSTKIYDRSGEHILYEISGDERRTLIKIDEIPDNVKNAVVSIEDKNFYTHKGFSFFAMARTAITNVIYNRSAGGSTLTQQFVKNAVLTPEKTIIRKVKEIIISYRLEKKFDKKEILQMYLNEIPYGSNAYGVEAASQKYFGKSVKDVTLPEAAVLAAIVQQPSRYSPYGPNRDRLMTRKDYVLTLMAEQGYISQEESEQAKQVEISFKGKETNITAPHFVMYIKDILAEKYGEKTIEQGGLKIITTLDFNKQKIAEDVIKEKTENYKEKYNASNAALVSIDPKTGQILAMVGSKDYFDDEIDGQVNVAMRLRQPGSSIKPLVYAALFEKGGYNPNTLLYDVNTNFSNDPANPYEPRNYDLGERGPVTIKKALAGSLNIPAVKALYLAGIDNVINFLKNLNYTSFENKDRFGLALVLGGAEVKLVEHVNAYSAFAREGEIHEYTGILKVEDKEGKVLEEYKENKKNVLSVQSARMINSIMTDNSARAYVFGEHNKLNLGNRPSGAKTGTTNDFRDAWTIGYTPSLVTGVWVGNSNNEKMSGKADGSVVAAPIWNEFMKRALENETMESFNAPDEYKTGISILDGEIPSQKIEIDRATGLLADTYTDPSLIEEKTINSYHSILYYINKDEPLKGKPENPENDPQFLIWEKAVLDWAKKNASSSDDFLLNAYEEFNKEENKPEIKINWPKDGDTINSPSLPVEMEAAAKLGISTIEYLINGNSFLINREYSQKNSINVEKLPNGFHNLKVKVCDQYRNCSEQEINFNLSINNNQTSNEKNDLNINNPTNGLGVSKIDFPLNINLSILKPNRVFKLNLSVIRSDGDVSFFESFNGPLEGNEKTITINTLDSGQYNIISELRDYNGDIIKKEIVISVN